MAGTAAIARENGKKGGRPPSHLTKMTRRKADELAHKNETPLDVMIDNMNFWRSKASELTVEMQRRMDEIASLDISDETQRGQFLELMREFNKVATAMLSARQNAQSCAVDAAPYVHPRFQSIAVQHQNREVKIVRLEITNPGGRELIFDADAEPRQSKPEHRPVIDGESTELKSSEAGD
jgi:hypothetical protein